MTETEAKMETTVLKLRMKNDVSGRIIIECVPDSLDLRVYSISIS